MPDIGGLALWLDLIGIFAFAVSGSLLAARKGFDIVGSLVLANLAGLGGGVVRDLVIGQGVPTSFTSIVYLAPPLLAAAAVYLVSSRLNRINRWILHFDAAGLALFCITGTEKALAAGLPPVSAALLGVATACGGGLLRDVAANEVPRLFDHRDIYALPAFLGAGLTALAGTLGVLTLGTGVGIGVVVYALRALAMRYRWRAPLAARGWARPGRSRDG
ncbi:trimeric intracellular cation channel family protein [Zafaria sp. J156]|uniref:trimeric intracellular cation channel family protein n=1 Tax=Zafaria sp. J156 TaxID=3116490 RepID=UPI002E77BAB8|nr:trimeric intracellular cation channel family protein [Zafaria sp. J156]MEE1621246.1 trimeric intracellular cation channel family protein [Zafaria sp. J156]